MRRVDLIATGVFTAVVVVLALLLSPFWLFLMTSAVITAVIALSVGVIYDNAGLLSLCQMTFAGLGAWTVGWLNLNTGLPYLVMLPIAGLVPLCVGVIIGVPALRLRGQNLAVFTLVFAAAVSRVIFADGFPGLIEGNRVTPPSFADGDARYFMFCSAILGLLGLAVTFVRRSPMGRWWFSVRRSERATAAMGRSVVTTKLTAFAASAGIAGIGGALLVALNGIVSGASFDPLQSMTILTSALMFGAGNFEGAVMAGLFALLIPNALNDLGLPNDLAPMIFAVGGIFSLSKGEGGLSAAIRFVLGKKKSKTEAGTPNNAGPVDDLDRVVTSAPGEIVLDIEGVGVSYGAIAALTGVSMQVPAATFVGLIGPNGAGKSTLIDVLSGFVSDHDGSVTLRGEDITSLPPRGRARRGLRRSFQQGHTPQDLTLGGYVEIAAGQADVDVDRLLRYFSLPSADLPVAALDVGSRRILEVCGVIASAPHVALLDEPAAGLAGPDRQRFIDAIAKIPETTGISIVLIEHDLDVVSTLCETVTVLDFGRVVASGSPAEVFADDTVVAAYMGAT